MYMLFLFWYDLINECKVNDRAILENVEFRLKTMKREHLIKIRDATIRFRQLVETCIMEMDS